MTEQQRIPFTCPHCGHHTEVLPQYAGRTGPCVKCRRPITIPELTSPASIAQNSAKISRSAWITTGWVAAGLAFLLSVVVIWMAVIRPALIVAGSQAANQTCQRRLQQIGQALRAYHTENGHYPPAVLVDQAGRQHSWRVLILPYLGKSGQELYNKYSFDEDWNGPQNSSLAQEIPVVYQCPSDTTSANFGFTNYLAVVGPKTVINNAADPTRNDQITDLKEQTLVIIEADNPSTNWMEPKDIDVSQMVAGLGTNAPRSPGSLHPNGVNALMADGSVITLPEFTSNDDLKRMSIVDDGDFVELLDDLRFE